MPKETINQIIKIWEKYISDNKIVIDTKGNDLQDIDAKRIEVINGLRFVVAEFINGSTPLAEFKTIIDSINKQNNLWGFTSIKGQMFFNLLFKTCSTEDEIIKLANLLKNCIKEPTDLKDALRKIEMLNTYCSVFFLNANDKRKAPNPSSICYFLSYFWQIQNYNVWPVMYSSMIVSLAEIGLWEESKLQNENYKKFYELNEEIKTILSKYTGKKITNWEAEHCFWNYRTITAYPKKEIKSKEVKIPEVINETPLAILSQSSFDIYDYIPRLISNLIDLGNETEIVGSTKGVKYEKIVNETFKQLGFSVQYLGQGSGREPDLIATHKEDNVAFIVDAKAYSNGYMMGAGDERAIREYINEYCPKLKKEGIQRVGFIIVSNSFKSNFDEIINDITWRTEIKRFILLTSDALLHLLAYKLKDQKPLSEIVDALISSGSILTAEQIIQKFDDF